MDPFLIKLVNTVSNMMLSDVHCRYTRPNVIVFLIKLVDMVSNSQIFTVDRQGPMWFCF